MVFLQYFFGPRIIFNEEVMGTEIEFVSESN